MAQIPASVNLEVKGGSKLERLIQSVGRLESIVNNINGSPLQLNVGKAETAFNAATEGISKVRKSIRDAQKNFNDYDKIVGNLEKDYIAFEKAAGKLTIGTKAHADALLQAIQAEGKLANAKNKRLELEKALNKQEEKLPGAQRYFEETQRVAKLTQALTDLSDEYLKFGKLQARTAVTGKIAADQSKPGSIAGLKAQADALSLIANNSEIASRQFNRFTIASQVAGQRVFEARQKQLTALAEGLSVPSGQARMTAGVRLGDKESLGAARSLIGTFVESYGAITKSRAALGDYISQASSLQSIVPFDSSEWNLLETVINDVNGELQQLEQRFKGLRGQSSNLAQAVADGIAPGIAAPRGQGRSQLLPQFDIKSASDKAKYYSKIEDQVSRLAGFEERIAQANLTQVQKVELRSRLDKAVSLLSENRLEDAKRETVEIEKQRMSLERMNRAGSEKPQGLAVELGGGAELRERNKYEAEQVRLRNQIAEATNSAAAAVQRLEAAQGRISMVQEFEEIQSGINAVSNEIDAFLKKDKQALSEFNKKLKETSSTANKTVTRGQAFRAGGPGAATAALSAPKRVESLVRSTQLAQEKLLELEIRGVDVSAEKASAQRIINSLKASDLQISDQLLNNADDELNLIRDVLRLEKQRLTNRRLLGGGAGARPSKESGFRAALTSKEIGAEINQIVSDFNKVVSGGGKTGKGAGANVVSTLLSEAQAGVPKASAAGEQLGRAVEEGLNDGLGIQSPSKVAIEAMLNVVNTLVNTAQSGKAKVQAALKDLIAPDLGKIGIDSISETLQQGKIKNLQEILPTSLSRSLAPRNAPFQTEIDPAYLANVLGSPLTRGRPSPAGIFPAPAARVSAPGSAFPFQTYDMSYPQFPAGTAAQLKPPSSLKNRPGDTSRILSAAIKEYRAAIDNFWEGEDSQFEAIKKIVVSSGRLAAAQLARRLQQAKDLTPDQQFQQTASEARSLISGGQQSSISRFAGAANDLITGERRLGISSAIGSTYQRISDSLLNSVEALGFTVSDGFNDAIDRVRNAVPSAFSNIAGMLPPGGFGGGGGAGAGAGAGAGGGAPQGIDDLQRALGLGDLAPITRATNEQLEELASRLQLVRNRADGTSDEFARLGRQLGTLGREQERRAPDADFLTRRFGPRGGRAVSEGLIGGAFPLLFGQGVGAAAGGGLGGALGGFAGGGLGFGLSLVGTAAGTAIDTLIQKSGELASALDKPAESFDKLKEISFFSAKALEKQIEKSQAYGNEVAVATAIQEEALAKLGVGGVANLSNLEKQSDRMNRAFAELSQQMQAVVAGPVSAIKGFFADIGERAAAGGRVKALRESLTGDQRAKFEAELLGRVESSGIKRGFFGGEASQAEIGLLADRNQLQDIVSKWTDIIVEGEIKITNEQELRTQINSLGKFVEAQQSRLSIIDISKGVFDQIKAASRQQEDLDRQRYDLIESYEKSISDIRLSVEKQITQERLANTQRENEALRVQGDIRLQQLKNANLDLRQSLSGNDFGQQLFDIVSKFTEEQLATENEIASRRKNLEAELQAKAVQVEDFKSSVAKQVADLNISTEKQISQLKLSTLRQSQDYDQRRFELEKQINTTRLRYELLIAKQKRAETIEQLKIEKDPDRIKILSQQAQIYTDLGRQIPQFINQIQSATAPKKIAFSAPQLGGSVSTAGFDAVAEKGKNLLLQIEGLQQQLDSLAKQGRVKDINFQLSQLADQGVSGLIDEYEQLKLTLSGGNAFDVARNKIIAGFDAILSSKGVIESVLSEPLSVVIRLYQYLALENQKLAETLEFVTAAQADHRDKIEAAKDEINLLLAGTSEYEKTLFNLTLRGIQPATEEFQALVASAKEVDRLTQKAEVLNAFRTAATELSGSIRGLVDDLIELGDASQAVANFTEALGKKTLGFVLDIAFKPMEDAMQGAFIQFAEKLGFDIKPEEQKQLESIQEISKSVDTIKDEIKNFISKIPEVQIKGNLSEDQKQLVREAIDQQIQLSGNTEKAAQQAGRTLEVPQASQPIQSLQVIPYSEVEKTVEGMNKVGEGTKQLAVDTASAVAQIDTTSSLAAETIKTSTEQVNSVIPAWGASLGKVVTGIAGAVAGITAISGGITQMKGGGTYGVLSGLAGIFGGIASVAGAFGSLSSLGGAAKGFSGGYFDPMTGLGAAGPNFGFAKGGMFSNSIVSSPTLFKFADGGLAKSGLMGEAGPEAIMPLTRGPDGRLGVDANGLSDAIAEARDVLDDGATADASTADEQTASVSTDSYALTQTAQDKERAGTTARDLAYVLQDSRGAIEDIKRVTREREAFAASMSPMLAQGAQGLLSSPEAAAVIRELSGGEAGSTGEQVATGGNVVGGVALTEAESFKALADARIALAEATQGGGSAAESDENASGGVGNVFSNADRRAAAANDKPSERLRYVLQDTRGAIDNIKQIVKEREATVSTSSSASADRESILSKDATVIREILAGVNAQDQGFSVQSDSTGGQVESTAVSAARDALNERAVGGGDTSETSPSVITNSSQLIEKIALNNNPFESNKAAIASSSLNTEKINTKESSALVEARETTNSMMALNQTRQMLNSVSTVNKERSVEKAIEATAGGSVKPLDVRYESQVINNVEYVTAEQHRKGISEAAERGRALTLSALKNSVKARRQVGM